MKVVIIDYGAGNVQSVKYALQRIGLEAILTENPDEIKSADKVIFPGVGSAAAAMEKLHADNLVQLIPNLKQDVLGICLGMQLMCAHSEEGNVDGLGIFDVPVKRFVGEAKIPHMGWNNLYDCKGSVYQDFSPNDQVYFVHSYYVPIIPETNARCEYILPFSAALHKNNFYAFQFHPEKSGVAGEILLKNFLAL